MTILHDFQESPTGELADFPLSSDAEEGQQESSESELDTQLCDSFCAYKEISLKISEEGEKTENQFL